MHTAHKMDMANPARKFIFLFIKSNGNLNTSQDVDFNEGQFTFQPQQNLHFKSKLRETLVDL